MSEDLVKRAKDTAAHNRLMCMPEDVDPAEDLLDELAAEIERLRAENACLNDVANRTCLENERRTREIAHLKGHCVERSDSENGSDHATPDHHA